MEYIDDVYYSDLDIIDLDVTLPERYISDKLGDLKFLKKKPKLYM